MLSSFILVDKPSRCLDCQIKKELRVTENVKIERSQEIDADVSSMESSAVTDGENSESSKHKDTD
jgi:hypothetical protein